MKVNTYFPGIGINSNSKSQIYRSDSLQTTFDTPGILDCNDDKLFWIKIQDNHISLGTGRCFLDL